MAIMIMIALNPLRPLGLVLLAASLAGCASDGPFERGTALPPPQDAPAAAAPFVPAVSVETMKAVTKTLASDALEGRAPSTAAEPKVLDAIVARFEAAGLQPGNRGEWLQEVPTVEITASDPSAMTVTGGGAPLAFSYGDQWVAASYRVVPQTRVKDSELVFVGYGINAPELGWNDYAGIDMKGKTAVILVNDPDYADEDESEDGFKGRRMTYYGRWTYKYEEAARQGADAAIIVHDTFPAAYGWNVVNSSWTGAQYYVDDGKGGMDQTMANGWVQKDVAHKMLGAAGQDLAALTENAQTKGFRPVPLGLKVSFGFDNTVRKSTSHNVIGLLPGTERPDEYVLYGAHWDHLGRCTPDASGDDICNGAVDNATGIGALVGIAEAEAQAKAAGKGTPRSQVFAAWTLEESGLLGSGYYAQDPSFPLAQTVGGVNMDALSPGGRTKTFAMRGGDKSDLTAIFGEAMGMLGLTQVPEPKPEEGKFYRSDHFPMAKLGVPMYHLVPGNDLVEGGEAAGAAEKADYTENRYHQPSDEYSADWNWNAIEQDVAVFHTLARLLATRGTWPNWYADDEFRAARDASCAASDKGC
jgi:Zn-dependent M28 family amino/carboxypeptidase